MRKLLLLLIQTQLSILIAFGQNPAPAPAEEKPTIESVDVQKVTVGDGGARVPTNFEEGRITPELRARMQELVGQKFDQLAADEVAFAIQNLLSDRISAIRQLPGSDADHIRLVFEVGGARNNSEPESNVNSRYIVEDVELQGVPGSMVSTGLREDLRKLVGMRMNEDEAAQLQKRLESELSPTRVVSRRVVRGADRRHVRVIYDVEMAPLFRPTKLGDYIVGHSRQSVSFGGELEMEHRGNRFALGVFNDGDKLMERFAGYSLTFESVKAGNQHVGVRIHYFNFHEKWKKATEQALLFSPSVPGIYRERRGIEPSLTYAFDNRLRMTLGASVTELQMQYPAIHSQNANAGIASVTFENNWRGKDSLRQRLYLNYSARAATHRLDSDFVYTRHLGEARYSIRSHHNEFVAKATAGVLNGNAPMFERFSLGNTETLRGWNKYDLNPIGGNRMVHGSLEYRYQVMAVYYDAGSVWDQGKLHEMTHAVGFGLHDRDGSWFLTLGVPIRSGHIQPFKPVFMLGTRF